MSNDAGMEFDALIIGGGFYGSTIASYLKNIIGMKRVALIEKEKNLLERASLHNQGRVHNGYHYPRSVKTAFRSKINYPNFLRDRKTAIRNDFINLYAIAINNSKVNAKQYARFCNEFGGTIRTAESNLKKLFNPRLLEEVFVANECVFNAEKLAELAKEELKKAGVQVYYDTNATGISYKKDHLSLTVESNLGKVSSVTSKYIFNCTYSGINQFSGSFLGIKTKLKHEITEISIIKVPDTLKDIGITVMDGSFFSLLPLASTRFHTLSHVRYTPHVSWEDNPSINPYKKLRDYPCSSRFNRMIRDSSRYVPSLENAQYIDSYYEIKTVLAKNEIDDGRPILFERMENLPGCYSVLGGKIDNIYDVLEYINAEVFR